MIILGPLTWLAIAVLPFWEHKSWQPTICRPLDQPMRQMSWLEAATVCPLGETMIETRDVGVMCCETRGAWLDPIEAER